MVMHTYTTDFVWHFGRTCLHVRYNTFGYRIVNLWNSLPEPVVEAPTLNIFKSRFDSAC